MVVVDDGGRETMNANNGTDGLYCRYFKLIVVTLNVAARRILCEK